MLLNLDDNSSMGTDGVHPRLLKSLAIDLCVPLSLILNSKLGQGGVFCRMAQCLNCTNL